MARYADIEKIEKLLVHGIDENGDSIVSLRGRFLRRLNLVNGAKLNGNQMLCFEINSEKYDTLKKKYTEEGK